MAKFKNPVNFNEAEKFQKEFIIEENIAKRKDNLRWKGIVPILKEGKLLIYKITNTEKTKELNTLYKENMFDIYSIIRKNNNDQVCQSDWFYLQPYFKRIHKNQLDYRTPTTKEIWKYFNLDDDDNKKEFVRKNAQEIEIHTPINEKIYTKIYRKEEIDEIIERIRHDYITYIYKRPSKISEIIFFVCIRNYINIDFIASMIYEYFYSHSQDFSVGINIIPSEQQKIDKMPFTEKEQALSNEEKIALIKEIIDSLNIECIYSADIDKISDSQILSIFGIESKKSMIEFATHNANVLYNSVFSDIYYKIMSPKAKVLNKNQSKI